MHPSYKRQDIRATPSFNAPSLIVSTKYHIPLLLGIAVVARIVVFHVDQVIFSWRATDMASIAMGYYRNGFHFLNPQVYWGGNGPGYVETEFPIIPFLLAVLYRLFGVHEWLALVIPMLSGVGVVIVVYLLSRHLFDPAAGFIAGVFTAVSPPLAALSMGLWPDPPMIFWGTLGLYLLVRWAEENTWGYFFSGAFATTLAILLKLTALYLGIPILFLCFAKYKFGLWKAPAVWLLAFLVLVPPALWYSHAYTLYKEYHNTFGILTGGYLKFANAELLLDPAFYSLSLGWMIFYHLTPFVFVAFVYGVLSSQRDELHYIFHVWFGAVVVYILVVAQGVSMGHFQYLIPVVPPAACLAGFGTLSLIRKLESLPRIATWPKTRWYLVLILVFLAGVIVPTHFYHRPDKYTTRVWTHDKKTGLSVGRVTVPGSLIIVVDTQMNGVIPERIMTPPNVFYFSDRRGWYVALSWLSKDLIEQRRREGARYLVITGNAVSSFGASRPEIKAYLSTHYSAILDNEDGVVYDLALKRDGRKSERTNRAG